MGNSKLTLISALLLAQSCGDPQMIEPTDTASTVVASPSTVDHETAWMEYEDDCQAAAEFLGGTGAQLLGVTTGVYARPDIGSAMTICNMALPDGHDFIVALPEDGGDPFLIDPEDVIAGG